MGMIYACGRALRKFTKHFPESNLTEVEVRATPKMGVW